jgi:predicted nicotinamide N-methyase
MKSFRGILFVVYTVRSIHCYEIPLKQQLDIPGISVHRVPLRFHDPQSPYALALASTAATGTSTTTSTTGNNNNNNDDTERHKNDQPATATIPYNFLATQVWPSARTAAIVIEKYLSLLNDTNNTKSMVICEFGCGPGLPSLTAALCYKNCRVIATDIDALALQLVRQAATEQNISNRVETLLFDLIGNATTSNIPDADIYILSDVFENAMVAKGAAQVTHRLLQENDNCQIWVFAQSDRAQREFYRTELQQLGRLGPSCHWTPSIQPPEIIDKQDTGRLWLCNIDETNVFYG